MIFWYSWIKPFCSCTCRQIINTDHCLQKVFLIFVNKNPKAIGVAFVLIKLQASIKRYINVNHRLSDDIGICKYVKLKFNIKLRKDDVVGILQKWKIKGIFLCVTVHLHFAKKTARGIKIPFRIRWVSSVVVEDYVPTIVRTGYGDRMRYCRPGISGISKTQHALFFDCCVGEIQWKSQKLLYQSIVYI